MNEEVKKMLQNKRPVAAGGDSVEVVEEEGFMASYPHLWRYLTQTRWEDGTARQPSSLSIFSQHGKWTIMLAEKNWGLILFATADRLEGLWEALDARLADPRADWREDRKSADAKAKRVQRPS